MCSIQGVRYHTYEIYIYIALQKKGASTLGRSIQETDAAKTTGTQLHSVGKFKLKAFHTNEKWLILRFFFITTPLLFLGTELILFHCFCIPSSTLSLFSSMITRQAAQKNTRYFIYSVPSHQCYLPTTSWITL